MSVERHGIYLGSWEHLYLIPGGVPAGLPNQLFSRHPWILILFPHIYCDENGFRGEENAAKRLGWTNSGLFHRLVHKEKIIQPVSVGSVLEP